VQQEIGREVDMEEIKSLLLKEMAQLFNFQNLVYGS
jgi:hypothetical protein